MTEPTEATNPEKTWQEVLRTNLRDAFSEGSEGALSLPTWIGADAIRAADAEVAEDLALPNLELTEESTHARAVGRLGSTWVPVLVVAADGIVPISPLGSNCSLSGELEKSTIG